MVVEQVLNNTPVELRNRAFVVEIIKSMAAANDKVDTIGVYFEPNAYDSKDANYVSADNPSGGFAAFVDSNGKVSYAANNAGQEWYTVSLETQKAALSTPYTYDGKYVVSYSMPIMYQGKAVDVVTTNIDLSVVQSVLEKDTNKSQVDYKVLCSSGGIILANSADTAMINVNSLEKDPSKKEVFDTTAQGKEVVRDGKSSLNGAKVKTIYVPVNTHTDKVWTFETAIEYNHFTVGAKRSTILSIVLSLATIIIIAIIILYLMKKMLTAPLTVVEQSLSKMANYDLNLENEKAIASKYINNND